MSYTLTKEQEAELKPWGDKWLEIALSTKKMSKKDMDTCRSAIDELYKALKYSPPKEVQFVPSPMEGLILTTTRLARKTAKVKGKKVEEAVCEYRRERGIQRLASTDFSLELRKLSGDEEKVLKAVSTDTSQFYNGGNLWAGTVSYISFFRSVVKLDLDWNAWLPYEQLAELSGPRYMHEDFCYISDKPEVLKLEGENLVPHCPDGPSHRWRDGFELYHWRGVHVPKQWIMNKDSVPAEEILNERNAEKRRAGTEIIGWTRILKDLQARTIDQDPNPEVGTLIEVDLPDAPNTRFIRVRCGTGREFAIPVDTKCKTALEANAWSYDMTPEDFKKFEGRT